MIPIVNEFQRRKNVSDWSIYETLAYIHLSQHSSVVRPAVLRVGFTGCAFKMMLEDPTKHWPKLLIVATNENQQQLDMFKNYFLSVEETSVLWKAEQKRMDMKLFGDRLILNNYFDDGVSDQTLYIFCFFKYLMHFISSKSMTTIPGIWILLTIGLKHSGSFGNAQKNALKIWTTWHDVRECELFLCRNIHTCIRRDRSSTWNLCARKRSDYAQSTI